MPNGKKLRSPAVLFVAYVAIGCLAIMFFRRIFPGESAPLPIFSGSWRMTLGFLDVIALFPALALSALALPFGMGAFGGESRSSGNSADLFKARFMVPVITAISAAAVYALLFFAALPLAQAREGNMRSDGEIYRMARDRALAHGAAGEWLEASQFIGIADGIWPGSPDLADVRNETLINLEAARFAGGAEGAAQARPPAALSGLPGHWEPMNAAQALAMGRAAYDEGRMFDAHWLASMGQRLAGAGSPEAVAAAQLASRAWNRIDEQRPSPAEARARELFELKRSGHEAMIAGDYIRAFYVFREHARLAPRDPDVENFLIRSEQGLREAAFFTDEMRVAAGRSVYDAIFSLPAENGGRAVLRLESLTYTPNVAFGVGVEYMLFDRDSGLLLHLRAPYAKFRSLATGGPEARQRVIALTQALDRGDAERRWGPVVESMAAGFVPEPGAQIVLDVSYGEFLTLSRMRGGVSAMHVGELFDAYRLAAETGYVPQVFQAEILSRLGSGLFFLPTAIAAIAAAWHFRARRFPCFLFVPLLFALPAVFNVVSHVIRLGLGVAGASLALALGFPLALILFCLILALAFAGSLFMLVAWKD